MFLENLQQAALFNITPLKYTLRGCVLLSGSSRVRYHLLSLADIQQEVVGSGPEC